MPCNAASERIDRAVRIFEENRGRARHLLRYAAREAGVRTRMFMLALVLGSIARAAQAQRVEVAMPQLRYVAPASCPDRSFFVERLRARLDAAGARALGSLSLRVELEPRAGAVHGSVRIERGAPSAPRTLEGGSCREVVEGLALIAALAVAAPSEPRRGRREASVGSPNAPPEQGGAGSSPFTSPSPSTSTSTSTSTSAPVAPADEKASAVVSQDVAPPAASPSDSASDSLPSDDAARVASEASHPNEPRLRGWALSAGVLGLHGLGPRLQPGLQLGAAVSLATGALDWSLRFGGRLALQTTETSAQGSAHFGFASGVVQLCATAALNAGSTLDGCAVAEPGALLASAENTRNPQSYTQRWFAAGVGAGLGWRAAPWLLLRFGGEVLASAWRDRMLLAGTVLHRVPPVCIRFGLSLEVPLG